MLAEALEDGEITTSEAEDLNDVATALQLSDDETMAANRSVLLALCQLALSDGVISRAEKAELVKVSELLSLPKTVLMHALDQAEAARHERLSADLQPLPGDWPLGEPLRVGDKVAFTGCDAALRDRLERRADSLGVRVMNNVSAKTAMLVTDGSFSGTKADAAAKAGCRVVHPSDFQTFLQHLQPAATRQPKKLPAEAGVTNDVQTAPTTVEGTEAPHVDPALVRQWARENGYAVGTRGRLHQNLFAAYAAQLPPQVPPSRDG